MKPAVPPEPTSTLPRRTVLKRLGLGGATVLVAASGVLSYRVYDNGVLNSGSGAAYDAWDSWQDDPTALGAVGAAILAANPHNTQAWFFTVSDRTVKIFSDPAREMPAVDPFGREHIVGLGCALENLVLALEARGNLASVTVLPDSEDPAHLASVDYTPVELPPGAEPHSRQYDAIGERHSNRGPYSKRTIGQKVLDALPAPSHTTISGAGSDELDSGRDIAGVSVRWVTADGEKSALGALFISATEAFIADKAQSEEAFSWFRNDRDDIDRHADGPTLDAQGFDAVTLALSKVLPASSRAEGDEFWLEQTRTVHTATAAAYGILTVVDPDDTTLRLAGGRLLQRIHLAATLGGIGFQHMNQITEQIDREASRELPPTFAPRLEEILAQPGQSPLVVFRVGYPIRAARRSPRRPVSEVLK